jgi:hypothetical protein
MATSNTPYRRQGINSWKELLDQVNDELQSPPSGCDPIAPIPLPDECHRWAKSDIREVHNKLDEMPGNCFTFQPIPDKWKVSIISDIENQLSEAWCDCGDEQCCEPCPNCQPEGTESEVFIAFFDNDSACCTPASECQMCTEDFCQHSNCGGADGAPEYIEWQDKMLECCILQPQIDDLNDELDDLDTQIDNLNDAKDSCITACGGGPVCIGNCNSTFDPQIQDAEDERDAVEAERDVLQGQKDTVSAEADAALVTMAEDNDAFEQCLRDCCGGNMCGGGCLIDNIPVNPFGGVNAECVEGVSEETYDCCGNPFSDCQWEWVLQSRQGSGDGQLLPFRAAYTGFFDNLNVGRVRVFFRSSCECEPLFSCTCCVFPILPDGSFPCAACSNCFGGPGGHFCGNTLSKTEWRSVVRTGPDCFDAFDCEDGEPCDGQAPSTPTPEG